MALRRNRALTSSSFEQWGVEPDILVTGKGLSGGLYPVSATLLNARAGKWLEDNGWGHVSAASPTVIGDKIYMPTMVGTVYVLDRAAAGEGAKDRPQDLLVALRPTQGLSQGEHRLARGPEAKSLRARSNKRCRNDRLLASGYTFEYPSFREGYAALIRELGLV